MDRTNQELLLGFLLQRWYDEKSDDDFVKINGDTNNNHDKS